MKKIKYQVSFMTVKSCSVVVLIIKTTKHYIPVNSKIKCESESDISKKELSHKQKR